MAGWKRLLALGVGSAVAGVITFGGFGVGLADSINAPATNVGPYDGRTYTIQNALVNEVTPTIGIRAGTAQWRTATPLTAPAYHMGVDARLYKKNGNTFYFCVESGYYYNAVATGDPLIVSVSGYDEPPCGMTNYRSAGKTQSGSELNLNFPVKTDKLPWLTEPT